MGIAAWGNALHTGEKSYGIVRHRRSWFLVSGLLLALAVGLLVGKGVNLGLAFRGGSQFTIENLQDPSTQPAIDVATDLVPGSIPTVKVIGNDTIRAEYGIINIDDNPGLVDDIKEALADAYDVPVDTVSSEVIGPTWGADVSSKALKGLIIFILLVTVVMTVYFHAWRIAAAALIALVHDLVFTVGIYAGVGFEITPASVIGFLTILGYSLYDTVVVFDKVRENTANVTTQGRYTYGELANLAVNQTLVRSLNTSIVALLPVSAILYIGAYFLGAGTLKDISLALFVGMAVGTYSSIFVATPAEVALREREPRIKAHTKAVLDARAGASPEGKVGDDFRVGALKKGQHKGVAAQPKRKRRS